MPKHVATPRDRLLETARTMFLRDGVPRTGINAVTASADVARMTLYNNFPSKEALVLAVFEREARGRRDAIEAAQAACRTGVEKAMALFDVALELAAREGFRGCAFINLAIEAAAPDSAMHAVAKRHKDWIRENLRAHLESDGFVGPDALADQICVLWDGGIVGAYVHGSDAPLRTARVTARALLRAAAP